MQRINSHQVMKPFNNKLSIKKLCFPHVDMLEKFWKTVNRELCNSSKVMWFNYSAIKIESSWNDNLAIESLKNDNKHITSLFYQKGRSGVYAIWECLNNRTDIVYIGQTIGDTSHQRMCNHFIVKDPRTGSKLKEVQLSVRNRGKLGLIFVEIEPKELRQYVEQKLINFHFGDGVKKTWNIKGRKKTKLINHE